MNIHMRFGRCCRQTPTGLAAVLAVFMLAGIAHGGEKPSPDGAGKRNPQKPGLAPGMVFIEGGCFQMGSPPDEAGRWKDEHRHRVCVRDFAIGKYEVTFEEYDRFAEATGRKKPDDLGWGRGDLPVININWHDAVAYAAWLSSEQGSHFRLPTEAEWEYAARAGTVTAYSWGNDAGHDYANYGQDRCCGGQIEGKDRWEFTSPVGSFPPNPWGLHDMAGNVEEWTCSRYDEHYGGAEAACAAWNDNGYRAVRGGSWGDIPQWVRLARREAYWPTRGRYNIGFRLVQDLPR